MTVQEVVTLWCSTFGISDPRVIEIALGVTAGGSLLLIAYFIISLCFAILGLRR
jgi:hypothetical protein